MNDASFDILSENIRKVKERISRACEKSGRSESHVKIVAVTKTLSIEVIQQAINHGFSCFGENYLQEALPKIEHFQSQPSGKKIEWHFIGKLQSNKAKQVVQSFSLLQSLDRISLAVELEKKCASLAKSLEVLVEVNAAGEESKAGASFEEAEDLVSFAAERCPHLKIKGLMTFPPYATAEESRPYFIKLRNLAREIERKNIPGVSMRELSMGVSNDFDVAIEEGATMVRLGTVLFGGRK